MHLLAALSMKNRALIALVTIVAVIFGGIALTSLKQELIPVDRLPAAGDHRRSYPGASPEVVNDDVSTPIETAIQGVPGLESTSTTSTTNVSIVSASFTYGTDLAIAEQKIAEAINRISSQLPDRRRPAGARAQPRRLPGHPARRHRRRRRSALSDELSRTALGELAGHRRRARGRASSARSASASPSRRTPRSSPHAASACSAITDALQQNGVLLPGRHDHRGRQDPLGADRFAHHHAR